MSFPPAYLSLELKKIIVLGVVTKEKLQHELLSKGSNSRMQDLNLGLLGRNITSHITTFSILAHYTDSPDRKSP